MDIFLKPHTRDWFVALEGINPQQATHTRQIIESAGRDDVCSVCGDDPAKDFRLVHPEPALNAVITLRLCNDCRSMRSMFQGETFEPLTS
jgi:hypothetical protein